MGRGVQRIKEAEITRLLKAALKSGYPNARVVLGPNGPIAVEAGNDVKPTDRPNSFD